MLMLIGYSWRRAASMAGCCLGYSWQMACCSVQHAAGDNCSALQYRRMHGHKGLCMYPSIAGPVPTSACMHSALEEQIVAVHIV